MRRTTRALSLLLATAVLALDGSTGAGATEGSDLGHLAAADGRLREGCHRYSYSYHVNPPPGDWSLETVVVNKRGAKVASGFFVGGQDPETGTGSFQLCRRTALGGRYVLHGLVSADDNGDLVEGQLTPVEFRLQRRR